MFNQKVYNLCKKIPKGRITTYKILAEKLNTKAYRAVGNALNKNRNKKVPCHRVINSNRFVGKFNKGMNTKIRLLKSEGVNVAKNKKIDLKKYLWTFK